ncbi:spore germination protein [Thermoactinomyces mirandus]|nr:spore germination protein [Thermoactinomyces mirandus]
MIKRHLYRRKRKSKNEEKQAAENGMIARDLQTNLKYFKRLKEHHADLVIRKFKIGGTDKNACVVYMNELVDKQVINNHILKMLMVDWPEAYSTENADSISPAALFDFTHDHILAVNNVKEGQSYSELLLAVLRGSTVLMIDGINTALILDTVNKKKKALGGSFSEVVVRGSNTAFIDTLEDNMALLRQNLVNPDLTFFELNVGRRTQCRVIIAYLNGLANPRLVEEVKNRIRKIDTDQILDSGYLEQFIEDNPLSPFPQLQNTERPDRVIAALNEGRVAILVDGSPYVLIAPVAFWMFLQSPEDYYERWIPGTLIRWLRYLAAFISLFLPSIYIAFTSFHYGLIPTELAISITATREGVPFPAFIEALFMEFAVEILREAGLRLPKTVGQTVSIVGGLVIGESAVRAGIASPIMVIVVAITAICSFAIPQYSAGISLRYLRFAVMSFAALIGLYGLVLFFLLMTIHLVRLESFGYPYLAPAAPVRVQDLKDLLFRAPLFRMKRRPQLLKPEDQVRQRGT